MTKEAIKTYSKTCFWFFIPVILFDMLFTKYLPQQYLQEISHPIIVLESIMRIMLIILSLLMKIDLNTKEGKTGIGIYVLGLLVYFGSYFAIINFKNDFVMENIIVQLSGYWTSIIWLIGIGLIGTKLFFKLPYHYIVYLILALGFAIIHTYHGYILLS